MDRPPLQQQAATVRPAEDLDEPVVYRDGAEKCQQEVADARRRWLLRRLRNEYRFDNIEDGREVGGCITERFQQRRGVEFDASDRRQFDPRVRPATAEPSAWSARARCSRPAAPPRNGKRGHHRSSPLSRSSPASRRARRPAEAHASRFRRRRSKPAEQQHRALIEDDGQRQRPGRENGGGGPPAPPSVP